MAKPVTREPKKNFTTGFPVWFHPHGDKLNKGSIRSDSVPKLFLSSPGQTVTFSINYLSVDKKYSVNWDIRHGNGYASGAVTMSTIELRAAFGLNESLGDESLA